MYEITLKGIPTLLFATLIDEIEFAQFLKQYIYSKQQPLRLKNKELQFFKWPLEDFQFSAPLARMEIKRSDLAALLDFPKCYQT